MKNKIKNIIIFFAGAVIIALLGLAPNAPKTFSLYWGNLGARMVEAGVIDMERFENLYQQRGGLSEADRKLLADSDNGNLVITSENSGMMLNMLWALGLGNKNPIPENGRRSLGEGGKLRFHRRLDAWQGKCHGSLQHASICNINQGTARSG